MIAQIALHLALLLLFPPLLLGVIGKTKAVMGGRRGAPIWQPYLELGRLLRKGAVYSTTTTWVFRAGPTVALAAVVTAGLLLPLAGDAPLGFAGDVILFAGLLGLARFATMAAALDTGSSFEAMGASREAAFAALAEPALFLTLAILCVRGHAVSFATAFAALPSGFAGLAHPEVLVGFVALFVVMLAECSRVPVDDPATHLELTMVHEVMVLDHSGPDLAFIQYGAALKLFLFAALLTHLVLPDSWLAIVVGTLAIAIAVGVVESLMARLRLQRVPQLLIGATVLAGIGAIVVFFIGERRAVTHTADGLLLLLLMLDLYILATSRLSACIRAAGASGAILAVLPPVFAGGHGLHIMLTSAVVLVVKAFVIPKLLLNAMRRADVRREVEPYVSLHASVVLGAALAGLAFWLARALVLPRAAPSTLVVPVAIATILIGFLVLVSRRKAITQVVGYVMLENGVLVFGLALAREVPFVVELGILLDVFVGVFVFGIVIHHISREFDHIDTDALSSLKD